MPLLVNLGNDQGQAGRSGSALNLSVREISDEAGV